LQHNTRAARLQDAAIPYADQISQEYQRQGGRLREVANLEYSPFESEGDAAVWRFNLHQTFPDTVAVWESTINNRPDVTTQFFRSALLAADNLF